MKTAQAGARSGSCGRLLQSRLWRVGKKTLNRRNGSRQPKLESEPGLTGLPYLLEASQDPALAPLALTLLDSWLRDFNREASVPDAQQLNQALLALENPNVPDEVARSVGWTVRLFRS